MNPALARLRARGARRAAADDVGVVDLADASDMEEPIPHERLSIAFVAPRQIN